MHRIGFLINPVAGMGGRVGLKGTDGVAERAIALGARPVAPVRARAMLRRLRELIDAAAPPPEAAWLACDGAMGAKALHETGFRDVEVVYGAAGPTSAADTRAAVRAFVRAGADIVVFCGGDGTARDVCGVTGTDVPILGVPAGVKMFSGVFGTSPDRTAEILFSFLQDRLSPGATEVLDLDEEKYRAGEWAVRLYHEAVTPVEKTYTQSAKMLLAEAGEAEARADIARFVAEQMADAPGVLFLLGAGGTVAAIAERLGVDKTLLGIDAVFDGKVVAADLDEAAILDVAARYREIRLVLSPIGAQGFVLGRGTAQLSPDVIRRIGRANLVIVATPAKLAATPMLRFDTGDAALDRALMGDGYLPVITGYRESKVVRVVV